MSSCAGFAILKDKISKGGFSVLWSGWEGNYVANVIGNYPWFATMNMLQKSATLFAASRSRFKPGLGGLLPSFGPGPHSSGKLHEVGEECLHWSHCLLSE